MLGILGAVVFEIAPVNLHVIERSTEGRYVEKPVLGRRPPLEFVGDGPETLKLTIKLFPEHLGGLGSLADLDDMRRSGIAQYFMRGDGVPVGWFAVAALTENSSFLGAQGIGRVIDVDVTIKRVDAPTGSDFFASIMGLF